MYIHPDDETTALRPYCSLRNAMEAANQESGHRSNCSDGAGGDCNCGIIDWSDELEPADSETITIVTLAPKEIKITCNCLYPDCCEDCIPF